MKKDSNDTAEVIAGYATGDEACKVIADRMGIPYSTLMRKLNVHDDYQINITEIIPLVLASNNFSLIEHICRRLNIMAVPISNVDGIKTDMKTLAYFAKESAEAMREMSEAFDDGNVDTEEAKRCRKEITELVQYAMGILRKIEGV